MRLISVAFRIIDWGREKKSVLECFNERLGGGNVAFQKSNGGGANISTSFRVGDVGAGGKGNPYNPILMGKGGAVVEVDYGQWGGLQGDCGRAPRHDAEFGCGAICHDGSYNLFKWDRTKGCMVPFKLSNPKSISSSNI
jgi:hypothetical protein